VAPAPREAAPVTVAVVSWNTRELLRRCLRSLAGEVRAGRCEVWVVDNASSDGSAQAAREEAPWAQVIEAEENLGFGRAVNLVARQTSTPWLASANADVALAPGALRTLLACGEDPRVGAVAPRLLLPDGRTQHSVYPFPTLPFTVWLNLGLHHLDRRRARRLCLEGFWDSDRPRAVPWAIAGFLLLRRAAFEQVGGFDERRWLYAEDLDLGWRLAERGWLTWYEPRAHVAHQSAAATAQAFGEQRTTAFTIATYEVIASRRGRHRAQATALVNVAGAGVRAATGAALAPLAGRARPWARRNADWTAAHLRGLGSTIAGVGSPEASGAQMRSFWNARAREDAFYFVDTRQRYRDPDPARFWQAEELLDYALEQLRVQLQPGDRVLEIGCGIGRITRVLAARARSVVALDVSDEMLARARELNPALANVQWLLGDGSTLEGIAEGSIDACVSLVALQHVPAPAIALSYVRELGRVLAPGGWAALQLSNDPQVHRPRAPLSWRLKALARRAPRGQWHPAWLGCHVELAAVERAAIEGGATLERVWGAGTQYCLVLLRKPDSGGR